MNRMYSKLKRIHRDLQVVAYEMGGKSDKPRDRKGDYIPVYRRDGKHKDRSNPIGAYFNAQLISKPEFHDGGWWEADLIFEADEYIFEDKNFFVTRGYWEITPNQKFWTIGTFNHRKGLKMPRDWPQ